MKSIGNLDELERCITEIYKTRPSSEKKGVFSFKNFWEKFDILVLSFYFLENLINGRIYRKMEKIF
jgi:hypothetical protein